MRESFHSGTRESLGRSDRPCRNPPSGGRAELHAGSLALAFARTRADDARLEIEAVEQQVTEPPRSAPDRYTLIPTTPCSLISNRSPLFRTTPYSLSPTPCQAQR